MPNAGDSSSDVRRLVEQAADAFARDDVDDALASAERALSIAPRSVAALHWRAVALAELGRSRDAGGAYEEALGAGPDDVDLLVSAADFFIARADPELQPGALERGLELARRGSRLARREGDEEALAELAFLEGVALSQLGEPAEALSRLDVALRARPGDPDVLVERGLALFELCRFEEARAQLEEALARAPDDAWAHHTLGLVAERRGDAAEADRRFRRARRLAPEDFPRPVELSASAFDGALEDALAALPEQVRSYLSNVAIAVEDLPEDDDLLGSDPPLSPSILGVFRGSPLGHKASMDPWSHFPSSIVLYQKNLERFARDRDELIEQIEVTLLHEVGHFLGLDEDGLYALGLE